MTHTSEWPMKVQPGLTDTELMLFLKERLQNFHQTNLVLSPPATSRDFPPQAEYIVIIIRLTPDTRHNSPESV